MKYKKIINIVLIIIWLFVIFSFSAEDAKKSRDTSDQVIIKTAEVIKGEELTPKEKDILINKYLLLVRKSAHFFLYFVLGILTFNIAKMKFNLNPSTIIYPLIFCFIYACSDEIHQLFIDGRTAKILDVFIDSSGAALSILILFTLSYIVSKKKRIS